MTGRKKLSCQNQINPFIRIGNMQRQFGEDRKRSSGCSRTDSQTDTHAHHNTPPPLSWLQSNEIKHRLVYLQVFLRYGSYLLWNFFSSPCFTTGVMSAHNKTVFTLIPRLSTWHCPHLLLYAVLRRRCWRAPAPAAVDRCLLPERRSAANPPRAAQTDGTDKQTDGRTLDRFIDPAPHTVRALSIIASSSDSIYCWLQMNRKRLVRVLRTVSSSYTRTVDGQLSRHFALTSPPCDGHRCNKRLRCLPYRNFLINAFVIFVNVYYFHKRHMKCRKRFSSSYRAKRSISREAKHFTYLLRHTRRHCSQCSVVWTLNLRLTDSDYRNLQNS